MSGTYTIEELVEIQRNSKPAEVKELLRSETVKGLKMILSDLGLKVAGNKVELVERIRRQLMRLASPAKNAGRPKQDFPTKTRVRNDLRFIRQTLRHADRGFADDEDMSALVDIKEAIAGLTELLHTTDTRITGRQES